MKHLALLILITVAGIQASAEVAPELETRESALQIIADFRRDPFSAQGRENANRIVKFAESRPDVVIKITAKVAPWKSSHSMPKYEPTLMTAFIAGNIRSQLLSGVAKDDPVGGVEQMVEIYRRLQLSDPSFKLPEVEKLIELQVHGKLRAYLEGADPA